MNAPFQPPVVRQAASGFDLASFIRFMDMSLECMAEARKVYPSERAFPDEFVPDHPERFALFNRLRLEAMRREGLPMEYLPASQRDAWLAEFVS